MKPDITPPSDWGIFSGSGLYLIAGPCSAETREQVLHTASALADIGIGVMRAGVWKPRTRPNTFEGAGTQAFEWLEEAKRVTGVRIACEVGCPAHVQECLEKGVDMVWIGARTTANPFLVQEIAEALRGADIPVLVKNPVNPDVNLWIGAIERLAACGLNKLGAVHRGVSSRQKLKYRNDPAWDMAIQLRSRLPRLPLFCDPSHMGGDVRYIKELSQRALDLGFEGLMIEAHCNPACALSDASQQLTPLQLHDLLDGPERLVVRESDSSERSYRDNITQLRSRIDIIDESLIELLSQRMDVSRQIGKFKKDNNIAIIQTGRWDAVMARILALAQEAGLSEDFVREVFGAIHKESVCVQNGIREERPACPDRKAPEKENR